MHYRWRLRRRGSPKDSPQWYGDSLQLTTVPLAPSVRSVRTPELQKTNPIHTIKRVTSQRWTEAAAGRFRLCARRERNAWPDKSCKGCVTLRPVIQKSTNLNLHNPQPLKMPEAGLTNAEASDVLKTLRFGIQGTSLAGARSASEILYEENCKLAIFTFSKDLDDLLGGGIAVGEITELCGCPGIGKTQACIQLCVSVQMPKAFGGYEGSAVYIDTEGSFMAERAREMARATVGHLFSISRFLPKQPSGSDPLAQFTEEAILDRFHLFRCHEITELLAVVESLPTYVKAHGVKLVVIDSIAFHFRQGFQRHGLAYSNPCEDDKSAAQFGKVRAVSSGFRKPGYSQAGSSIWCSKVSPCARGKLCPRMYDTGNFKVGERRKNGLPV